MRIALAFAAVVLFAAAPSAQAVQDLAPAFAPAETVNPTLDEAPSPEPALAADVDLSEWVTPSTVAAPEIDIQDAPAEKDAGADVVYYGSLVATTAALAVLATFFL